MNLSLGLSLPAIAARPAGGGGGGAAAAVAIAGTPAGLGSSGAHTTVEVADYDHAGGTNGALLVLVSGRPASGGEQAVSVTWNGVAVPERVDTSDGGAMTANESFVWVGLLAGAAAGVKALAVGFDKSQSDSVVQCISLVNVDQAAPVVGVASSFDETEAATVATAGRTGAATGNLFVAGAGIALGSTLAGLTSGWSEVLTGKSDTGISTSTATLATAARAPSASEADPLTVTFADSTTRARALALVEVKAAG